MQNSYLRAPTLTPCFFARATVLLIITGSPACPPHAIFAESIMGMSSSSGPPSHSPNASPQSTLISILESFVEGAGVSCELDLSWAFTIISR